jgi:hypothetical protein
MSGNNSNLLQFGIMSGPHAHATVFWDGVTNDGKLFYGKWGYPGGSELQLLEPSSRELVRFWNTVDRLGVWGWDEAYELSGDISVCDGFQWSLTLAHQGKNLNSEGDNAYPDTQVYDEESPVFRAFCRAISRLVRGDSWGYNPFT